METIDTCKEQDLANYYYLKQMKYSNTKYMYQIPISLNWYDKFVFVCITIHF